MSDKTDEDGGTKDAETLASIERLLEVADVCFIPDPATMPAEIADHWRNLNAEIGYITSEWGNLETQMGHLLAALLRSKLAYAQVILATLSANKIKRDVIMNVARVTLASERNLHVVEALMRRTAKVASKRNFIAHGTGMFHTKFPDRLTIMGVSADLEPALSHYQAWSLTDLRQVSQTLKSLSVDVSKTAVRLRLARRLPSRETRPTELDGGMLAENSRRPPRPEKRRAQPKPSRE